MLGFLKKRATLYAVAIVGLAMAVGAVDVCAQTAEPVVITPIVDFSSVFTTIASTVGPVIVGAIGLGLSIWAVRFMFSLVKSMGRS